MAGLRALGSWWKKLPVIDRLILTCTCLIAFGSFGLFVNLQTGQRVSVYSGSELIYNVPLDEDSLLEVRGPLGVTVVKVENHSVRILSSPCPNKTCVRSGAVEHVHDLIACLPNHVFVKIEGEENHERGYDLLSR